MFLSYETFLENLARVEEQVSDAISEAGRPDGCVRVLPVTKNHPPEAAMFALRAGVPSVGENRVQEALTKMETVANGLHWELIGPLQSNKARKAAGSFWRIQTVDRPKIVDALQRHAADLGSELRIMLQVNAGGDPKKAGVSLVEAERLMEHAMSQPNLKIDGLMTIAPLSPDSSVARACFANLRQCRDRLSDRLGASIPELSMGMSGDLREAILEGSTMVRLGTALYGVRSYE